MEKVFDNNFAIAYYIEKENQYELKWKATSEILEDNGFKNLLLEFADIVDSRPARSIFVDASEKYYVMSCDVQKWHDEEIIGRYLASGVKNMAFHVSNNTTVDFAINLTFDEENAKNLPTELFDSREVAKKWLLEQAKVA